MFNFSYILKNMDDVIIYMYDFHGTEKPSFLEFVKNFDDTIVVKDHGEYSEICLTFPNDHVKEMFIMECRCRGANV